VIGTDTIFFIGSTAVVGPGRFSVS
jgi:hypothetical protein